MSLAEPDIATAGLSKWWSQTSSSAQDGDQRVHDGDRKSRAASTERARRSDRVSAQATKSRERATTSRKSRAPKPSASVADASGSGAGSTGKTAESSASSGVATPATRAPELSPPKTSSAGSGPRLGAGGVLSWAPPAGWTGFPVREVTATDSLTSVNAKGGDVVVKLPSSHSVGPIAITNCRNAVLIGGSITVLPSAEVSGADQRAIYVKDCTGTVHIEGVHIRGDVSGSESDGIAVNAPEAVLQIQNVRVDGMRGGQGGNHADVFQPWGGVREFRIDRLTGSSNYQGLHIFETLGPIGRGVIRNTNIAGSDLNTDGGGYFIWMDCEDKYPLALEDVYVKPRPGRPFNQSVWPSATHDECPGVFKSGMATWPQHPSVSGGVREGTPAGGDFVPAARVGLDYASPGYR